MYSTFRQLIYDDTLELIKDHFLNCMMAGAWFNVPLPSTAIRDPKKVKLGWRFCKLSANQKHLCSKEFPEIMEENPEFHTLTDRLDLSSVHQFICSMPYSPGNVTFTGTSSNALSKRVSNRVTTTVGTIFTFVSETQTHLLDLVCPNAKTYFEWVDGFRAILGKPMADLETFEITNALTEAHFQVQCLDIKPMQLKVTEKEAPPLPPSFLFYYQDQQLLGRLEDK
ncbi:hypothetical protein HMI55_001037 [Coelomomyces lativittatus]|nr:hypothetical protein HMI55_001037 [Coelomomyces lativittatus]